MNDWAVAGLMLLIVCVLLFVMAAVHHARHLADLRAWSEVWPRTGPQRHHRVDP